LVLEKLGRLSISALGLGLNRLYLRIKSGNGSIWSEAILLFRCLSRVCMCRFVPTRKDIDDPIVFSSDTAPCVALIAPIAWTELFRREIIDTDGRQPCLLGLGKQFCFGCVDDAGLQRGLDSFC